MKICMVGTGRMAAAHSRSLAAFEGVELDTLVGARESQIGRFAEQHGYPHAGVNYQAALGRDRVDAVVICTPNQLHYSQTMAALRAGKHVLCEIPLAMSLAETRDIGALAARAGRHVMVCHTERFEPGRLELQRLVRLGELSPLQVQARFQMFRRGQMDTGEERRPWDDNLLWHHGCHTVDAIQSLLGAHDAIDLQVQFGPAGAATGAPLDWLLQWRTPTGVLVSASLSHNAQWSIHDYRLVCAQDTVVCDHGTLSNREGVIVDGRSGMLACDAQDREFVDAIRADRSPAVDVKAVLPTMEILQAAWERWLSRR